MEFTCRITKDAGLDFGERNAVIFKKYRQENPGMVLKIIPQLPESGKQRRFFEGGLVPLVTFYQDSMNHRSHDDCRKVREWLKEEFNGELVEVAGKVHHIAKSTKGREVLGAFIERVVEWLVENYAPPIEAMDPASYKRWCDMAELVGTPETYIDYLLTVGLLHKEK